MFRGQCIPMVTGGDVVEEQNPSSIFIVLNHLPEKEPHQCKFDDCQRPRRGYSDFCRKHKAIGKIISGKMAREKAIAEIAARDKSNQVTEVNSTGLLEGQNQGKKRSFWDDLILLITLELGFYIIIIIFFFLFALLG